MITPTRKLVLVLLALFIGESMVMAFINILQLPPFAEALMDASVLITIALPILYFSFVRPMVQQFQIIEEARKTTETLLATSIELSESLELNDVIKILLRRVNGVLPYQSAVIYLLEEPTWLSVSVEQADRTIKPLAGGIDPHESPTLLSILHDEKMVLASDMTESEGQGLVEADQDRTWLGIPISAGGKVIGVAGFGHHLPRAFSQGQVGLAEGLVSLAAVAVHNASLYDQVRSAREQLKNLSRFTVNIYEKEKRLLSRDLYDDAGQALASVLLKVQMLNAITKNPELMKKRVSELQTEISQILENLQRMAVSLRPASLEHLGLVAAIQHDLDRLRADTGLATRFDSYGYDKRLPEPVETSLYRITQEAFSNVVAHACATKVEVSLSQQEDWLVLVISDNGQGFQVHTIDASCCLGLLGMRERAEMVGGEFNIESESERGTSVIIRVPVPNDSA